ncbi:MAG: MATE family efflux transporter [Rikenellaceae bacterium]
MYSFSKYREQYRLNLKLAIPVAVSQLGQIVVQLVDNMMIGQYGGDNPLPMAATSFGSSLYFLIFIACLGLTYGITPLVGEKFAQGDSVKAVGFLSSSLVLFSIIGVIAMGIQFSLIPLMKYMGQPQAVVELAIPYFSFLVWSMFPVILFFVFKQFLEGVGNTKVVMWTVIASNVVNVALNYILIYGMFGLDAMGATGAGLATLISRLFQAAILITYFVCATKFRVYLKELQRFRITVSNMLTLLRTSIPISMQVFFEASAFTITSILIGRFNEVGITANQIAITMANVAFMILIALGTSTTIRISHCYGERDFKQIKLASEAAWHLGLVWNAITALIFISLRGIIPYAFTSNHEVVAIASTMLIYVAAFQVSDGLQFIGVGVLKGMQDVKAIIPIAIVSYWVLNIPIGYLCAVKFNMGASGFYVGYIFGLSMAAMLIFIRIIGVHRRLSASN